MKSEDRYRTIIDEVAKAGNEGNDIDTLNMILNEDIFNLLNEIAPEGTYYGSHERDVSCFGFWNVPEDDTGDTMYGITQHQDIDNNG